ncbi:MAG: calcineurin-like phosphoesterase C-terminal domain-containing protein, partial [Phycisphaerae bacterium]
LKDRPHTLSISAHTHIQQHFFLDKDAGWLRDDAHHHFNAGTVCGSWWAGMPDEDGIPHSIMRCGAPNGYNVLHINREKYWLEYVPARRPASHQLNIFVPDEVNHAAIGDVAVLVNVFAGSEKSRVDMRVLPHEDWTPLQKVSVVDPSYQALFDLHEANKTLPGRPMPKPLNSPHIWSGRLPADLPVGVHVIQARTRDMYGREFTGSRIFRVRPASEPATSTP